MRTYIPLSSRTAQHIQELMKQSTSVWEYRRLQCIALRQFGMQAQDVAKITGLQPGSVKNIWSLFHREGFDVILGERRGRTRNRAHLTRKRERRFLQPFFDRAEGGKLTTVRHIHRAHCRLVEKRLDTTVTYRLLSRHGWRRVVPRPRHPKADTKAQEEFRVFFPQSGDEHKSRSDPLWAPFPVDVQ